MNLQESIRRILKGVAKKLSNKLHCDRHGSCVHFAELFVEEINNTHPELLKEFEVIEGYVDVKFGEGKPQEHTWIRLSDDEVIDPTFMQFTKYDKNAKYSRKRTKSYTGQEYYDKGVIESWFSKRREEQPDTVFKGGLEESIRRILRETLESKWNKGNYNYQHGYCHYFAYDIIGKIKKRFPNKKVNYYMILANEVDKEDGTIVQDYLIHVYIQIDNMLLDSNGITTHDKAWEIAEEWEQRQAHLVPKSYETKMWEEESDTIPKMFFNNSFCNTRKVKKDVEDFLNNPIVQRILRDL